MFCRRGCGCGKAGWASTDHQYVAMRVTMQVSIRVRFLRCSPETRGGTELGVSIDPAHLDLANADWERRTGTAKLAGELVLDYVRVRCHAAIDLATLAGTGRLEPLGEVEPGVVQPAGGDGGIRAVVEKQRALIRGPAAEV